MFNNHIFFQTTFHILVHTLWFLHNFVTILATAAASEVLQDEVKKTKEMVCHLLAFSAKIGLFVNKNTEKCFSAELGLFVSFERLI